MKDTIMGYDDSAKTRQMPTDRVSHPLASQDKHGAWSTSPCHHYSNNKNYCILKEKKACFENKYTRVQSSESSTHRATFENYN